MIIFPNRPPAISEHKKATTISIPIISIQRFFSNSQRHEYTVILRPFFHVKYENKHHQKDGTYRHRKHCIQQYPSKSFTQQEILCPVSLRHHLIYSKSCKGECRNDYTTEQQEAVIFPVIFKIVPDHLIKNVWYNFPENIISCALLLFLPVPFPQIFLLIPWHLSIHQAFY